jgi:hypothetical protein
VPESKGGSDDHHNLVILCPNHHREAHEDMWKEETLREKSIGETFKNWLRYYNPNKKKMMIGEAVKLTIDGIPCHIKKIKMN